MDPCFTLVRCDCGEVHADEPCPACTVGDYQALEERLSAALRREAALKKRVEIDQALLNRSIPLDA